MNDLPTNELVAMIRRATPADLDAIDAEIKRLQSARSVLAAILGVGVAKPAEPEPSPGKALPPQPGASQPRKGTGSGSVAAEQGRQRRLVIARLLLDRGPMRLTDICKRLVIPQGSITGLLACAWFEKSSSDPMSPYQLTQAGRDAAASSTPTAKPVSPVSLDSDRPTASA